jgi:hypothetical protein
MAGVVIREEISNKFIGEFIFDSMINYFNYKIEIIKKE